MIGLGVALVWVLVVTMSVHAAISQQMWQPEEGQEHRLIKQHPFAASSSSTSSSSIPPQAPIHEQKLHVVDESTDKQLYKGEDELARRQLQGDAPSQLRDSDDSKNKDKQNDPPSTTNKSIGSAFFIKQGKAFYVTSRESMDLHDRLPIGTYSIGINPATGEYFLQTIDSFEIKGKIYGDTKSQAQRILSTFLDRKGSTGV